MVNVSDVVRTLKLAASLGELHDVNPFKLKALSNAAFYIDKHDVDVLNLNEEQLSGLPGIGNSIAQKIISLRTKGSFDELDQWAEKTPFGVVELLGIKGLGGKKVKSLWKELGIESIGELVYACKENRLTSLKGFGEKTQAQILQTLEFALQSKGKFYIDEAIELANQICEFFENKGVQIEAAGEIKRKNEIVESLCFFSNATSNSFDKTEFKSLELVINENEIVGKWLNRFDFKVNLVSQTIAIGPESHLSELRALNANFSLPDNEVYKNAGLPFIKPEHRDWPLESAVKMSTNKLIEASDIKGVLHCHSTYSDGANTLKEMALAVKSFGYEYFGICDHSKAAFYANGLKEESVLQQHEEINRLNSELSPFKLFKGIECDILSSGDLDYDASILKSFDFVVASVHSNLRMDEEKAMKRLIKAIENPFTTILGHPTGRLLLSRQGYPLNFKKIIDACAANGVVIELNAHPYRLDIDWRHLPYCIERGVMISINPDAHEIAGLDDVKWGLEVAQKGGLTTELTLNSKSLTEIENYFLHRKANLS